LGRGASLAGPVKFYDFVFPLSDIINILILTFSYDIHLLPALKALPVECQTSDTY